MHLKMPSGNWRPIGLGLNVLTRNGARALCTFKRAKPPARHTYMHTGGYHQTSNISRTLVGNKIVDHSDVVGASSPVALLLLHLHPRLNAWLQWIGQRQLQDDARNI